MNHDPCFVWHCRIKSTYINRYSDWGCFSDQEYMEYELAGGLVVDLTAGEYFCVTLICRPWKCGDRTRFTLYLHNKSPYCQTDNTVRSSVSNRSIHPLEWCSDCRRRSQWMEVKKSPNRTRCSLYLHNQGMYGKTDNAMRFSASNRSIYPLEGCSECRRRSLWMEM